MEGEKVEQSERIRERESEGRRKDKSEKEDGRVKRKRWKGE